MEFQSHSCNLPVSLALQLHALGSAARQLASRLATWLPGRLAALPPSPAGWVGWRWLSNLHIQLGIDPLGSGPSLPLSPRQAGEAGGRRSTARGRGARRGAPVSEAARASELSRYGSVVNYY